VGTRGRAHARRGAPAPTRAPFPARAPAGVHWLRVVYAAMGRPIAAAAAARAAGTAPADAPEPAHDADFDPTGAAWMAQAAQDWVRGIDAAAGAAGLPPYV
jgi:hypothetical protein